MILTAFLTVQIKILKEMKTPQSVYHCWVSTQEENAIDPTLKYLTLEIETKDLPGHRFYFLNFIALIKF